MSQNSASPSLRVPLSAWALLQITTTAKQICTGPHPRAVLCQCMAVLFHLSQRGKSATLSNGFSLQRKKNISTQKNQNVSTHGNYPF